MNYRQIVKNVPLFAGLSEPDLDDLMTIVRINDHPRGELLFSEGETAVIATVRGTWRMTSSRGEIVDGRSIAYAVRPGGYELVLYKDDDPVERQRVVLVAGEVTTLRL